MFVHVRDNVLYCASLWIFFLRTYRFKVCRPNHWTIPPIPRIGDLVFATVRGSQCDNTIVSDGHFLLYKTNIYISMLCPVGRHIRWHNIQTFGLSCIACMYRMYFFQCCANNSKKKFQCNMMKNDRSCHERREVIIIKK